MGTKLGAAGVHIELHDESGYEVIENPAATAGVVGFSPRGELNKILSLSNTASQDTVLGYGYQLAKYNQGMYAARAVLNAGGHVEYVRPYGEEIDKSDPYKRDLKTDAFVVTYDRNAYRDSYPYEHTSLNTKHFAATRFKTDAAAEYGVTRKINNISETIVSGKNIDFGVSAGSEFADSSACRWYDPSKKMAPTDTVLFSILNSDPSSANRAFISYEVSGWEHASGSTAIICTIGSKPAFGIGDTVYLPVSNGGTSSMFATAKVTDIVDYEITLEVETDDYFTSGNQEPNTIIFCDDENAIADGYDYLTVNTAVAGRGVKTFTTSKLGDGSKEYSATTSIPNGLYIEVSDSYKQSTVIRFSNPAAETNKVDSCELVEDTQDVYTIVVDGDTDSIMVDDVLSVSLNGNEYTFAVVENDTKAEIVKVHCQNDSDFRALGEDYTTQIAGQKLSNNLQDNPYILTIDATGFKTWNEVGAAVVTALKDDSIGYGNTLILNDVSKIIVKDGVCNVVKVDPSAAYDYAIGDTVALVRGRTVIDTGVRDDDSDDKFKPIANVTGASSVVSAKIAGLNVMAGEITLEAHEYVTTALDKVRQELESEEEGAIKCNYQLLDLTQSTNTAYTASTTEKWTVETVEADDTSIGFVEDPNASTANTTKYVKLTSVEPITSEWTDDDEIKLGAGDVVQMQWPAYESGVTVATVSGNVTEGETTSVVVSYVKRQGDTVTYYNVATAKTVVYDDTPTADEATLTGEQKVLYKGTDTTSKYYLLLTGKTAEGAYQAFIFDESGKVVEALASTAIPEGYVTKKVTAAFTIDNIGTMDKPSGGSTITVKTFEGSAVVKNADKHREGDEVTFTVTKSFSVDFTDLFIVGSFNMYVSSSEQNAAQIKWSVASFNNEVKPGVYSASSTSFIAARSSKVLADDNIGQSFLALGLAKTSYEDVDFTGEARQVYVLNADGENVARLYLGVKYKFNGRLYEFEGTIVPYVINDNQLSIVDAADYELTNSGAKFVLNESGVLDAFLTNNAYDLSQTVVDDILNGSVSCISFNVDDPAIKNDAVWTYDPANNRSGSTIATAWNLFLDKDASDIHFLVAAGTAINNLFMKGLETLNTQVMESMLNVCETRKDCFALFDGVGESDIEKTLKKANPASQFETNLARWGFIYDGRGVAFDSYYTKSNVEIVKSIQLASIITANRSGSVFWRPAANQTGRVPAAWGAVEKYPRRYNSAEDTTSDIARLSNIHMNPTRSKSDGIYIWGDFTMQQEDTALNQMHAIMLIAGVHKMFYHYLDNKVFLLNTAELRNEIQSTIQGKLDMITTANPAGFYEAVCVCDNTNNTPDLIDQNKLYVDIRMRLTKSTRNIYLRSTVLPTADGNQVTTTLI